MHAPAYMTYHLLHARQTALYTNPDSRYFLAAYHHAGATSGIDTQVPERSVAIPTHNPSHVACEQPPNNHLFKGA